MKEHHTNHLLVHSYVGKQYNFPPGLSLRCSQNQGKCSYFPFTSCFLLCQSTFKSFPLWRDDTRRFASVTTFLWRDSHWSFELQVLCKQAQKGQHISPFVETRVRPVLEWRTHWPSERPSTGNRLYHSLKFEILGRVTMTTSVSSEMTPCSLVKRSLNSSATEEFPEPEY